MTTLRINGSETGVTRVFALDLPAEAVARFVTEAETGEWPLRASLGAKALRARFVDTVDLADLGEMPLTRYLTEAHGVPAADLAPMAPQLDGLRGHVLILPAQAFAQTTQVLTVASPLRWIGTFGEERPTPAGPAVESASAATRPAKAPVSHAAMSGRVATLVLLLLFAFVALLVWIAA